MCLLHPEFPFILHDVYRPDNNNQRTKYWTAIAEDESEDKADDLLKGLCTYALAFDACKAEKTSEFERLLKRSRECWMTLQDKPMIGFITRNLELGVCPQCVQEMTGIMDGCEMRFKQFVEAHIRMQERQQAAMARKAAPSNTSTSSSSSKGVKLVPGGTTNSDDKVASKSASGLRVASSPQQANVGIQALREEMKKGYQLYDDQQCVPYACSYACMHVCSYVCMTMPVSHRSPQVSPLRRPASGMCSAPIHSAATHLHRTLGKVKLDLGQSHVPRAHGARPM